MKTLYYVVTKQLDSVDGFEETNGWKTVNVYEIKNDTPNLLFEIEMANSDNTTETIQDHLDENGYSKYKFVQL